MMWLEYINNAIKFLKPKNWYRNCVNTHTTLLGSKINISCIFPVYITTSVNMIIIMVTVLSMQKIERCLFIHLTFHKNRELLNNLLVECRFLCCFPFFVPLFYNFKVWQKGEEIYVLFTFGEYGIIYL